MYVLFQYPAGVVVEGVVLANEGNRMRVAAPGFEDAIELHRSGANWIDTDCQCVELEFIMSQPCDTQTEVVMPLCNGQAMMFANAN
jgi:hypothetical protein